MDGDNGTVELENKCHESIEHVRLFGDVSSGCSFVRVVKRFWYITEIYGICLDVSLRSPVVRVVQRGYCMVCAI
jgi:hypothetical protein